MIKEAIELHQRAHKIESTLKASVSSLLELKRNNSLIPDQNDALERLLAEADGELTVLGYLDARLGAARARFEATGAETDELHRSYELLLGSVNRAVRIIKAISEFLGSNENPAMGAETFRSSLSITVQFLMHTCEEDKFRPYFEAWSSARSTALVE